MFICSPDFVDPDSTARRRAIEIHDARPATSRAPDAVRTHQNGTETSIMSTQGFSSRCMKPPVHSNAGLKTLVSMNLEEIDAREINSIPVGEDSDGNTVVARVGRYGPYVKYGKLNASLPKDMSPDDITLDQALELLAARAARGPRRKGGRRKK